MKLDEFKKYQRKRYKSRRRKLIKRLGGICVKCGSTDRLEFDHIDPKTKSWKIGSSRLACLSWKRIITEVNKCQLLCYGCHRRKSVTDIGNKHAKHGTDSFYRRGCRCDDCKKAHSIVMKKYRGRVA